MDVAIRIHGALCGDQRLTDHLSAEDTLPAHLRAQAAIEVFLQLFEVERLKQDIHRGAGLGVRLSVRFWARHFRHSPAVGTGVALDYIESASVSSLSECAV